MNNADLDSYEVCNILNYFGFPFEVEEEDFWNQSRKEFGFSKTDPYPFLVINSANEEMPEADLSGRQNIMTFLYN